MKVNKFDPRGKEFHFKLDKYSCYRCKEGNCSLKNISLDELKEYNSSGVIPPESSKEYCIGMAKLFLEGEFETPAVIYKQSCGHYSFSDGQHRTCVVAHLLEKDANVILKADVIEQNILCYVCVMKEKIRSRESKLTLFDKIFKTRRYKELIESKNRLPKHNFIYKL